MEMIGRHKFAVSALTLSRNSNIQTFDPRWAERNFHPVPLIYDANTVPGSSRRSIATGRAKKIKKFSASVMFGLNFVLFTIESSQDDDDENDVDDDDVWA